MKKNKKEKNKKKFRQTALRFSPCLSPFPAYLPSMPALPLSPPETLARPSPAFTRMAVEDVAGGQVKVYFSRDTTKKLDQPTGGARGTSEIEE